MARGQGVAEAQEEDRELLLRVRPDDHERAARGTGLVDRGAGNAGQDVGGEPVPGAGVDVLVRAAVAMWWGGCAWYARRIGQEAPAAAMVS